MKTQNYPIVSKGDVIEFSPDLDKRDIKLYENARIRVYFVACLKNEKLDWVPAKPFKHKNILELAGKKFKCTGYYHYKLKLYDHTGKPRMTFDSNGNKTNVYKTSRYPKVKEIK